MAQTPNPQKLRVISLTENSGFRAEVLEYTSLDGCRDLSSAEALFYAKQAGIRLKLVRITINQSAAILESGALYFLKGNIHMQSKAGGQGGLKGLAKGLASKAFANETIFRPLYSGTGVIYLEPSFGHFLIYNLAPRQALIADRGMFYCSEGSVDVSVAMQTTISAGALGGEGLFQTRVMGPGICVFSSPVPPDEIIAYDLQNERLQVDGNFALMRTEGVQFSVQRSSKSIFGSATGGEGLLQTFEGTGRVWVAPTQAIYDNLDRKAAYNRMQRSQGSSNTQT
ncbi:MAG: AIM24 family protein [Anaerolineae bacterium]|nr:AIM24 family protein [Anaerolineae bacterium]